MDKYKISGQDLRSHYEKPVKLADVFSDIERELKSEKKVVCRYIVNNQALEEHEEFDFADMELSQVESLEYWADHVGQLVLEVVESWIHAIPELVQHCDQISQKIRFNGYYTSLNIVTDLFQNSNYLVQSLSSLRQILGNSEIHFQIDEKKEQKRIHELMKETMQAIEKKDSTLLADILEFDLAQTLSDWEELLTHLKKSWEGSQNFTSSSYGQIKEICNLIQRSQKVS